MLGEIEGRRSGNASGWDGWMASLTRWTWVWASSRCWWWTGKPGMLQSMGVAKSWTKRLNWLTKLMVWNNTHLLTECCSQMFDMVLDCTPQAFKSCPCPDSRVREEPRISNRDISGLMDGGSLHVWSKVLEQYPTLCGRWWAGCEVRGLGKEEGTDIIRLAHQLPGNQRSTSPSPLLW